MTVKPAARRAEVGAGITLAYEEFGDPAATPLLLIMGLGVQMIGWREGFCRALAEEGLRVVRFDNRDVGESTWLDGQRPDLRAIMAGDPSSAPYVLEDMARDSAGLLDHLELDSAHVVGASMGGMIAQVLAAGHPERVRSLTSIMSTTGERGVSRPTDAALKSLFQPRPTTAGEAAESAVETSEVIGSPEYPSDHDELRATARLAFERGYNPIGFMRQLAAIWASGDRTESVRSIQAPTLVIHGEQDPLVPIAGGRATATAVVGSTFLAIEGMGHDLPQALQPQLVAAIASHVEQAQTQMQTQ